MKTIGLFVAGMLLNLALIAQVPAFQFPKIPNELVKIPLVEEFPEAEAVVLTDFGEVSFSMSGGKLKVYYSYYREVKVQKEEGIRWATVQVDLAPGEELIEARGFTYSILSEKGKVEKLRMEKRAIREEILPDGRIRKTFKLPRPVPGSVMAYTYTVNTEEFKSLRPWKFQDPLPVMRSDYYSRIPEELSYLTVFQGDASRLKQGFRQYAMSMNSRIGPGTNGAPGAFEDLYDRTNIKMISETHYYIEDGIPPLKDEPFMSPKSDLETQIQFQLSRIGTGRKSTQKLLNDWESINASLLEDENFGMRVSSPGAVPQDWLSLWTDVNPSADHMAVIYNVIQDEFTWSGEYGIYAERSLKESLESEEASSAEINLTLAAILQKAGYRASPLLVSTREHGLVVPLFPKLEQFNHVVVQVDLKGKRYFLDASHPFLEPDMLPQEFLYNQGFRVHPKKSGWVDIEPSQAKYRRTYARFYLRSNGSLEGKLSHVDKGYAAVQTREILAKYDEEEDRYFREQIISEYSDAKLKEYLIRELDRPDKPLLSRCEFTTDDFVIQNEEMFLVRPLLSEGYEVNPFPNEDRQNPIDFGLPILEQYVMVLTIPDGYSYEVVPEDIAVSLPNKAATFMYKTKVINQHIQLLSRITINRHQFMPDHYDAVRLFFQHVASKHDERLIIRKGKTQ